MHDRRKERVMADVKTVPADPQHRDEQTDPDDEVCKWGPCKPACCQWFRNPKWLLLCLCLIGGLQGLLVSGFFNVVVSTIERRFELSSTESGIIISCYDIASAICLIPISYFGGLGNKPRYVAFGVLTLGIGSFLCALPHFTTGLYTFENTEDNVCQVGGNATDICETGTATSSISNYKYVFIFGQLLHGAGAAPFYTLGIAYMDENVSVRSSSLYNGIFLTSVVVGAAVGFLAGSSFLNLWTDVGSVDTSTLGITPSNSRWVGAWWMGFLLSGALAILISIPMAGFPKSMPGSKKYREEKNAEVHASQKAEVSNKDTTEAPGGSKKALSVRYFLKLTKGLLKNPTYVFLTLCETTEGFIISGFSTFSPKFLEAQFNLTASSAAFYIGIVTIVSGGVGTFTGGYLVKRLNLKLPGILKCCIICCVINLFLILSFLFNCENVPFAGINVNYQNSSMSNVETRFLGQQLDDQCNSNCGCVEEDYHPICGRDGVMYFSPCYAGCEVVQQSSFISYNNCSCIHTNHTNYMAVFTSCKTECGWLNFFLPMLALMNFFTFILTMPTVTASLRCLTTEQRAYGLGIQWVAIRCIGSIPGPIVFGALIDLSCLVWQKQCDGLGSCFFYDNRKMSYYIMGIGLVVKFLSILFFGLAWLFYRKPKEVDYQEAGKVPEVYTMPVRPVTKAISSDYSPTDIRL